MAVTEVIGIYKEPEPDFITKLYERGVHRVIGGVADSSTVIYTAPTGVKSYLVFASSLNEALGQTYEVHLLKILDEAGNQKGFLSIGGHWYGGPYDTGYYPVGSNTLTNTLPILIPEGYQIEIVPGGVYMIYVIELEE